MDLKRLGVSPIFGGAGDAGNGVVAAFVKISGWDCVINVKANPAAADLTYEVGMGYWGNSAAPESILGAVSAGNVAGLNFGSPARAAGAGQN